MTPADKAARMLTGLDRLSREYRDRPDIQHAISEFVSSVGPSQMAVLYDLVTAYDSHEEALASLSPAKGN